MKVFAKFVTSQFGPNTDGERVTRYGHSSSEVTAGGTSRLRIPGVLQFRDDCTWRDDKHASFYRHGVPYQTFG